MRSAPTSLRISTGSMSRRITDVPPRDIPLKAQPLPPMWNSGMATRLTVRSSISKAPPAACSSMTSRFLLASITPLGTPVVPDVYNCMDTSSGSPSCPGSVAGRSQSQSS